MWAKGYVRGILREEEGRKTEVLQGFPGFRDSLERLGCYMLPNQARYQTSLNPEIFGCFAGCFFVVVKGPRSSDLRGGGGRTGSFSRDYYIRLQSGMQWEFSLAGGASELRAGEDGGLGAGRPTEGERGAGDAVAHWCAPLPTIFPWRTGVRRYPRFSRGALVCAAAHSFPVAHWCAPLPTIFLWRTGVRRCPRFSRGAPMCAAARSLSVAHWCAPRRAGHFFMRARRMAGRLRRGRSNKRALSS